MKGFVSIPINNKATDRGDVLFNLNAIEFIAEVLDVDGNSSGSSFYCCGKAFSTDLPFEELVKRMNKARKR